MFVQKGKISESELKWKQVEPNLNLLLDPKDAIQKRLLKTGKWEPQLRRRIEMRLPPGGTFVDVGTHMGFHGLAAANCVGRGGHIIAIEPNPAIAAVLRQNVDRNCSGAQFELYEVACADEDGQLTLFVAPRRNTGETSLCKQNASQEGAITASYEVIARRLDSIFSVAPPSRIDVIKIDVEGAELMVLKGAIETLRRFRPVLFIEIIEYQLKAMGTSGAEVAAFLMSQGYYLNKKVDHCNLEFTPVEFLT